MHDCEILYSDDTPGHQRSTVINMQYSSLEALTIISTDSTVKMDEEYIYPESLQMRLSTKFGTKYHQPSCSGEISDEETTAEAYNRNQHISDYDLE